MNARYRNDDTSHILALCEERLLYDKATGGLRWKTSAGGVIQGSDAGNVSTWGYLRIPLNKTKYSAHRLIWLMEYGRWPSGQIDHIDGDKLNNVITNLRDVSPSANQLAKTKLPRNNTSGYVGVQKARGGYMAVLKVNDKQRFLGEFASAEAASLAYKAEKSKALNEALGITPAQGEQP